MPILRVENIKKAFPQKNRTPHVVIENMNFEVRRGQFVCLLGPSGCGKTTLLTMLGGFANSDEGEIYLSGKKIAGPGPDRGYVFQNYALFPWMTVKDNILYALNVQNASKSAKEKRLKELLDLAHLNDSENKYPIQLSGGMQQRVAVVRALASHPEVLLLDEPLGAVDFQMRELLQEELDVLVRNADTTVVMVTHDVNESIFLSNRVIVMSANRGRIVADVDIDLSFPRDRRSTAFKEYSDLLTDYVRQAFHEKPVISV